MEDKIKLLADQLKTMMATEKKFVKDIRKLLDKKDRSWGKKTNKSLKKLEFYLEGGEELYKDAIKILDKHIEKNHPIAENQEEEEEEEEENSNE